MKYIFEKEITLMKESLDVEEAMRIGLIVNKLVANSVKNRFHKSPNKKNYVYTWINKEGQQVLDLKNNVPGVVVESTFVANPDSLRVGLIELLKR
jgi:two-component sensor histidine kinase